MSLQSNATIFIFSLLILHKKVAREPLSFCTIWKEVTVLMSYPHRYFSLYVLQTRVLSCITVVQTSNPENWHWYINTIQSLYPTHALLIVPMMSLIEKGSHISFNQKVSLFTFNLQHLLGLSLTFLTLTLWKIMCWLFCRMFNFAWLLFFSC